MTYNRSNTNNVKLEMDFEQIQSDLKKFKNQEPAHEIDGAKLLRYIDKLERLIINIIILRLIILRLIILILTISILSYLIKRNRKMRLEKEKSMKN